MLAARTHDMELRLLRAAARGHQVNAIHCSSRHSVSSLRLGWGRLVRLWRERRVLGWQAVREFAATTRAVAAIEMAILLAPTLLAITGLVQIGIIYIHQASFDIAFRQYNDALVYSFSATGNAGSANTAQQGYAWMCAALERVSSLDCESDGGKQRLYVGVRAVEPSSASANRYEASYVQGSPPRYGGTANGYDTSRWNMPAIGSGETRVARVYYLLPVAFGQFLAGWGNIPGEGHVVVRGAVYAKPSIEGVPPFVGGVPNLP